MSQSSNYRIAFDVAMKGVRGTEPERIARNAGVEYRACEQQYIIPFFQQTHIVDCKKGEVVEQDTGRKSALGTGVVILNYLRTAADWPVDNRLISLKEVPNGGMIFYPAFKNQVIDSLIADFQYDVAALEPAAIRLGGQMVKMGHAAARFQALPKIALAVVLWGGDDEMAGSANVLFDRSVGDFLPVEDIIGLGYCCAHKLIKYHGLAQGRDVFDSFWDSTD